MVLWIDGRDICTALGSLSPCCRPGFWVHSSLELSSNRKKQIDIPKFSSWLHWPHHLPVPLRLSFHWPHHLACQPCVYSVPCTAATQDFLDSVQMKEDQTLVFLTYCDLKSFGIISKQSNRCIRVNNICPSCKELNLYNYLCLSRALYLFSMLHIAVNSCPRMALNVSW